MSGTTRRLVTALTALAVGLVVLPAGVAQAADVSVGLSSVKATSTSSGSTLTGVITLSSKVDVQVDPASLKVKVDGQEFPATVKQAAKLDRKAMLVIDTSGSMGSQGMSTVRKAAATYLKTVPADVKVGVASFANTAGVDLAPTLDRAAAQRVINGLDSRGDTSLYAGMQSAAAVLGGSGDRSIVLLSDGADTTADNKALALKNTVAKLKAGDIRVDVVRFKTNDPDATGALKAFADTNGGTVVGADNTAGVSAAFAASARALNRQVQFSTAIPKSLSGLHQFDVSGVAGTTAFGFSRQATFGAPVAAPSPTPSATPGPAAPAPQAAGIGPVTFTDRTPYIAGGLLALALFVLLSTSLMPTLQTKRERRIASIGSYVVGDSVALSRQEIKAAQSTIAAQLLDMGDRVMKDRKSTSKTMALIERADLPFRAGEWLILRVVAVIVGVALGMVLVGNAKVLGLILGGVLGLILMPVGLRFAASRRSRKFEAQLPQILLLISTSLRSGFGLPQALDAVARDAAEPAGKEFSRALAETRIGTDISDALERVATRMESTSMHWTVMAIRIQREVGGNLAETLRTTAGTLRERESLQRQVSTLSAEGRLSAYILIALPIFIFIYMTRVNYGYVSLLWTTTVGLVMSVGGLVALGVGILWMRQVVKIEV
ncbi:type II secretion system F family protein [Terrabacter sp. Root181]|uniref:type II secretion system F family protein n=1 Tax=Terrabacter sp. Root181 TaxID=1736484 RepID=UPI0006FBBCB1|nr:type II secretion system F family protein [Terrabacter sp. Root181]KRB43858.1 type II secretion protein F [Terrabacter sp. Root181]